MDQLPETPNETSPEVLPEETFLESTGAGSSAGGGGSSAVPGVSHLYDQAFGGASSQGTTDALYSQAFSPGVERAPSPGMGGAMAGLTPSADVPRHIKLAHVQSRAEKGVDVSHLKDMVLDGAYNLSRMADRNGHQVAITSGYRSNSKTFHGHGEGVDLRILDKDGKFLSPEEELRYGREYGYAAGFGSMLNELRYLPDGTPKAAGDNPHLHFAWGNENNAMRRNPQGHFRLRERTPNDDPNSDYYKSFTPLEPVSPVSRKQAASDDQATVAALQHNIDPTFFKGLIRAESGGNPHAISQTGAFGRTQLMPDTAAEMAAKDGVSVESIKRDPRLQDIYGAKYLAQLKANHGQLVGSSYARLAAAYNAGPGGLEKMLASGKVYGETAQYVYNILHDIDPSIKSVDDAKRAILSGGGYSHDPRVIDAGQAAEMKAIQDDSKGMLQRMMSNTLGTTNLTQFLNNWNRVDTDPKNATGLAALLSPNTLAGQLLGGDTTKTVLDAIGNSSDASGASARAITSMGLKAGSGALELVEQLIHHISFGATPQSGFIKDAKEHGDSLQSGLMHLADFGLGGAVMSKTVPIIAGGIGRFFKWIPEGVAGLEGAGAWMASAEGASALGAKGGAALLTGLAADAFGRGTMSHLMDEVWYPTAAGQNKPGTTRLYEAVQAGMLNAGVALALGVAMPTGIGLSGLAAHGVWDTTKVVQEIAQSVSPVRRAVAGSITGATTGGIAASLAKAAGLDQILLGKDMSLQDAVSQGVGIGAGVGGLGGLASGSTLLKALANSPAGQKALAAGNAALAAFDDKILGGKLRQSVVETWRDHLKTQVQASELANADVMKMAGDDAVQQFQGHVDTVRKSAAQYQQKYETAESAVQSVQKTVEAKKLGIPDFNAKANQLKVLLDSADSAQKAATSAPPAEKVKAEGAYRDALKQVNEFKSANPEVAQVKEYSDYLNKLVNDPVTGLPTLKAQAEQAQNLLQQQELAASLMGDAHTRALGAVKEVLNRPDYRSVMANEPYVKQLFADAIKSSFSIPTEVMEAASRGASEAIGAKFAGLGEPVSKDLAVACFERMREDLATESFKLLRSSQDPSSAYGRVLWSVAKAIDPTISELRPDYNYDYQRDLFELESLRNNKSEPSRNFVRPSSTAVGGEKALKNIEDFLNRAEVKLPYDYNAVGNKRLHKVAMVRPGVLINHLEKVGERVGLDSSVLRRDAIPADILTRHLDKGKIGIESLGDAVRAAREGGDPSPFYRLYEKAVAAERVGSSHLPVVDVGRGDFVSQAARKESLAELESKIDKTKEKTTAISDASRGQFVEDARTERSGPERLGAYTDLAYNPSYVAQSLANTLQRSTLLRDGFTYEGGRVKFNEDAATAFSDLARGELSRIADLRALVRGKGAEKGKGGEQIAFGPGEDATGWAPRANAPITPVVLESTRQNLVEGIANYAKYNPELNANIDSLFEGMGGWQSLDAAMVHSEGREQLHRLLNPDGYVTPENIKGWSVGSIDRMYKQKQALDYVHHQLQPEYARHVSDVFESLRKENPKLDKEEFLRDTGDVLEGSIPLSEYRRKWAGDGNTDKVDSVVAFANKAKGLSERIIEMDPLLGDFMRQLYLHAVFPDAIGQASKMSAEGGPKVSRFTTNLAAEQIREFGTLKALREANMARMKEVEMKSGMPAAEFANLPFEERFITLKGMARDDYTTLKETNPKEFAKRAAEVDKMTSAYLFVKHSTDIPNLVFARLKASINAVSWRRVLDEGMTTMADLTGDGKLVRPLVIHGETRPISVPASGGEYYRRFSEIPGMDRFQTILGGKSVQAGDVLIHPELYKTFMEQLNPALVTESDFIRGAKRIHDFTRNFALLGSFMPHMSQVYGAQAAGWLHSPIMAMKLPSLGRAILDGAKPDYQQMVLYAIRAGLNGKMLNTTANIIAREMVSTLNPDLADQFYGLDKPGVLRVLQSMSATDKNAKLAYDRLTPREKLVSDVIGAPMAVDYIQQSHSLFRGIEAGMLGAFFTEMSSIERALAPNLKGMSPEIMSKTVERTAAHLANAKSGALPYYMTRSFGQGLGSIFTTPNWLMSKAHMIIDALDGVFGLGYKTVTGAKAGEFQSVSDYVAGKLGMRKKYANYSPEQKEYIRNNMAASVGSLLLSATAMATAYSYMKHGASPLAVNPPDKPFHLKVGDTMYSNPLLIGSVKDVLRTFGEFNSKGVSGAADAITGLVERNLAPDIKTLIEFSNNKDQFTGKPIHGDYRDGLTGLAQMGGDLGGHWFKNTVAYQDIAGMRGSASLADVLHKDPDYLARTMTTGEYLMKQIGSNASHDNAPQQIQHDAKARYEQYHSKLEQKISDLAVYARDNPSHQAEILHRIEQLNQEGHEVVDSELRKYLPDGRVHLSSTEINNILVRTFNPQEYAANRVAKGSHPYDQMAARQMLDRQIQILRDQ